MKKAIIAIITVLVLALGTCTCLYFFTDVFNFLKPASTNFSMQAKKLLGTDEEKKYSDYEEFLNKLKTDTSYTADSTLSMNMNLPSSVLDKSTQKLINSSSIKYSGSYDATSKAQSNKIGLYNNSKEVLTLNTLVKDQSISLGCTDLYDKTLTFDLSKLKSFCETNNITVDEDSLNSLSSLKDVDSTKLIYDLFYISEDDYNSLDKKYGNLLVDLIDKDNYSTKRNQKVSVDGDEVKTTAYSLTLSGEDAYNFINKLIDLVKNDDTMKKLIISKYDILKKYSTSMSDVSDSSTTLPDLTNEQIDNLLSEIVKSLESSKDEFTKSDKCLQFTIYSDKKSEPVKFEIAVLDDKKDKDGSVIFTEELSKGCNTYTIDLKEISKLSSDSTSDDSDDSSNSISSSFSSSNSTSSAISSATSTLENISDSLSEIIIKDKYDATDDSRKGTVTVSAKASGSKQELLTIDYDTVNSKSELKTKLSVSSPVSSSISFDYNYDVTGLDTDTQSVTFDVSGKYSIYSLKLSISGKITTEKSDIPELTSSNSVDVFSLSATDFQTLVTDVVTKASDTLPSKLSTYGINVTKNDILSLITSADTTVEPTTEDTTTTEDTSTVL